MKRIACFVLLVFCGFFLSVPFVYSQEATVKLKDGSVLKGTVLSRQDNFVRIRGAAIGDIWINKDDIVSVQEAPVPVPASASGSASPPVPAPTYAPATGPAAGPTAEQFKAYQDKILGNPQTMASIKELAGDKDIQEIVSDPALRDAIMRNDLAYLENNPKFQKFIANPNVQKLVDKVSADDQGAQHAR